MRVEIPYSWRRIICAALFAAGCASARPQLVPAPEANRVLEEPPAAVAEASGVRVTAVTQAWTGRPSDLESLVTPLRITVENQSGRPISVRYETLELISSKGFRMQALPPFSLTRGGYSERHTVPDWGRHTPYRGVLYSSYGSPYGWGSGLGIGFSTYETEQPALPTNAMINRALPEGVLEPNGVISGFAYFPTLPNDADAAVLHMRLVDAQTEEGFGEVSIPFVLEKR